MSLKFTNILFHLFHHVVVLGESARIPAHPIFYAKLTSNFHFGQEVFIHAVLCRDASCEPVPFCAK